MRVLVLSPHRDDAAFSCGLILHELLSAGHSVSIVNVCTVSRYAPLRLAGQPRRYSAGHCTADARRPRIYTNDLAGNWSEERPGPSRGSGMAGSANSLGNGGRTLLVSSRPSAGRGAIVGAELCLTPLYRSRVGADGLGRPYRPSTGLRSS